MTVIYEEGGKSGPVGIGGWLILPAIATVLSPLSIVATMARGGVFDSDTWEGVVALPPLLWLLVGETILNFVFLGWAGWLIYLLFSHRRQYPLLMILFLVTNAVVMIADLLVANLAVNSAVAGFPPGERAAFLTEFHKDDAKTYRDIARAVLSAAIWVPYLMVSRRVHATFTK